MYVILFNVYQGWFDILVLKHNRKNSMIYMSLKYVQSMITIFCVQFCYKVEKGKKWDYEDCATSKATNY